MFIYEERASHGALRTFADFIWSTRGSFMASGLGMAAAYALMELLPAQLRQFYAQSMMGIVLVGAMLLAVLSRRLVPQVSRKVLFLGALQLLVFILVVAPSLPAHAGKLDPKCTLATPCGLAASGAQANVVAAPTAGYKQVYKSIYNIGKTADGKYNVYNIQGDLSEPNWTVGNYVYSEADMLRFLPAVDKADVGKTVQCETLCKNAAGQVIGVNPIYKAMSQGKHK